MNKKTVPLTTENLEYLVKTYGHDPVGFARDICGFKKLDKWQIWYLNECMTFGNGGKKIAISSCHSSGKTLFSSVMALHRLVCYPESQIKITSATYNQLRQAFGGTLIKVIDNSLIKDWFDIQAESITIKGLKGSWIQLQAWSVQRPESFAGNHSYSPCLIADEASAIDPVIFESFSGSMMHPNSLMVLLGNPLHRRGELYEAFHSKKDFFHTAYVSAHDSSFIDPKWIQEMKDVYGEDSDVYRVRVLGEFPKKDIDSFIPESLIRSAVNRDVIPQLKEPIIGGLDIGQYRDASVLTIRQGNRVFPTIYKWRTREPMDVAENVNKLIIEHNIQVVCVDENGIGAGVGSRLRQLGNDKIYPVKLSNLPNTEKIYYNGRAKLWGMARDWLKYGSIPDNKDLIDEGSSLLYTYDALGRYQLERKQDALKRGIPSPDDFDSFAYTFGVNPTSNTTIIKPVDTNISIAWY